MMHPIARVALQAMGFAGGKDPDDFRPPESSSFQGAELNRLLADWFAMNLSADQEVQLDLLRLRARSRELARNTDWGTRFIGLLKHNVVGPRGITLQANATRTNEQGVDVKNIRLNQAIEESWRQWGLKRNCTVRRIHTFTEFQRLLIGSWGMDGEALVRKHLGFENEFNFALQFIDPDLLDDTLNITRVPGERNEIRMGVEIDQWGAPGFYHFHRRHPAEGIPTGNRLVLSAEEIIHVFLPHRIDATRGLPLMSPVMWNMNMLRGYLQSELVAARVAAAKTGFITRKDETGSGGGYDPKKKKLKMGLTPGTLTELPVGAEVSTFDPQHPNANFPAFLKTVLRLGASGLNVAYQSLTGDLEGASFSSTRFGALPERDFYRVVQQLFVDQLLEEVYPDWERMALLSGRVDRRVRNGVTHTWQTRGWPWIDPVKDVQAASMAIKERLTSRRRVLAEQGLQLEDVFRDIQEEEALAKEMGIELAPIDSPKQAAPVPQPEEPDDNRSAMLQLTKEASSA